MVQVSGKNFKIVLEYESSMLSKDIGLKDIGHNMSIGNLILGINSFPLSCLILYDNLLQNRTAILL